MEKQVVLICNAGSSTLKLAVLEIAESDQRVTVESAIERTIERTIDSADDSAEYHILDTVAFSGCADTLRKSLQDYLTRWPARTPKPAAILHRVVHAGLVAEQASLLDQQTLQQIAHWSPLAPLHNALAQNIIAYLSTAWPAAKQYAIFDSGLYEHLPAVARHYALPEALSSRWPIQRYGFHGLAHRSQWRQVNRLHTQAQNPVPQRLISVQLGGGCSITAWCEGKVIDTSMGFTPLEGLPMANRSGSIDPGILLHLLQNEGMSAAGIAALLNGKSGLASIAGSDGDIRQLIANTTPQTELAIAHYCYQIRKHVGAAIAVLGGIDAISFGGGTGEHQAGVRGQVLSGLQDLGIELDSALNQRAQGTTFLHSKNSQTAICLTVVNELDEMIRQYQHLPDK